MPKKFILIMIFVSIFWYKLSSSIGVLDPQDHKAIWLLNLLATSVTGIIVLVFVWWCSKGRLESSDEVDIEEDSELTCFCGQPAKLRISRTWRNPYRLFYNCANNVHCHQCRFFCWSNENSIRLERYLKEKKIVRDECIRLQKRVEYVQSRRRQEKSAWGRVRADLITRLSAVQSELDEVNKKIQQANESEEMPPLDESHLLNDDHDSTVSLVVVTTVDS